MKNSMAAEAACYFSRYSVFTVYDKLGHDFRNFLKLFFEV